MGSDELTHLRDTRDEYIRYQQTSRLIQTLGFTVCLLGGFLFGYMTGWRNSTVEVVESRETAPEGLWERAEFIGSPKIR